MKIPLLVCLASVILIPVIAAPNKKHHSKRDIDVPNQPAEPEINDEVEVSEHSTDQGEKRHGKKHAVHKRDHLKRASSSDSNDTSINNTKPIWPIIFEPNLPLINEINFDRQEVNPFSAVVTLTLRKQDRHNNKNHGKRDGGNTTSGADGKDVQDGKDGQDVKDNQTETSGQDVKDSQDVKDGQDGKSGQDGKNQSQSNQLWDLFEQYRKLSESIRDRLIESNPLIIFNHRKLHSKRADGDTTSNSDGKDDEPNQIWYQLDPWTRFLEDALKTYAESHRLRNSRRKHHNKRAEGDTEGNEAGENESDQILDPLDLWKEFIESTQPNYYVRHKRYHNKRAEGNTTNDVDGKDNQPINPWTSFLEEALNAYENFVHSNTPHVRKHHDKRAQEDTASNANGKNDLPKQPPHPRDPWTSFLEGALKAQADFNHLSTPHLRKHHSKRAEGDTANNVDGKNDVPKQPPHPLDPWTSFLEGALNAQADFNHLSTPHLKKHHSGKGGQHGKAG